MSISKLALAGAMALSVLCTAGDLSASANGYEHPGFLPRVAAVHAWRRPGVVYRGPRVVFGGPVVRGPLFRPWGWRRPFGFWHRRWW